jgi:hypothetical protein
MERKERKTSCKKNVIIALIQRKIKVEKFYDKKEIFNGVLISRQFKVITATFSATLWLSLGMLPRSR